MKKHLGWVAGVAALSLVAAPVSATPRTAEPNAARLSLSQNPRAATTVEEANALRGGFIIPLIAVVAVILGILAISGGDDHRPSSP